MNFNPPTPVERVLARHRLIRWLIVVLLVLAALYYLVFVNQYVVAYKDNVEHFKYGSIGYRRFGLLYENEQSELPIGMSRRIVTGVDRVWLNCAVCHVGTYRINA